MRDIRFRAWDSYKKDFITWEQASHDYNILASFFRSDFLTPSQYTGLHDENGVEIYEGDIVKHWTGFYKVLWDNWDGKFGHNRINEPVHGFVLEGKGGGRTAYRQLIDSDGLKVIGNIYENKELLK